MEKKGHHYVLGVHQSGPTATAALLEDGKLVAAIPEERITRIKQDASFPHKAIQFCLRQAKIGLEEVSHIAIGWNPGENASLKYRAGFSERIRYPGDWLASVPNNILPRLQQKISFSQEIFEATNGKKTKISFFDHHECHARLAYEVSGFTECAILVADGYGEQNTTTWIHAKNGVFKTVKEKVFPHSLGCLYSALTDFLGYSPFSDEWRVMGMAAYGDPAKVSEIRKLIALKANGDYELDLSYFDFYYFDRPKFYSEKLVALLGPARKPGDEITQRHFDIAAATQAIFEESMDHILAELHRLTGTQNLCLSGGSAMNCLYNGKISDRTKFKNCHVTFAPDDSGNSIGAAFAAAVRDGVKVSAVNQSSALGAQFSDESIEDLLTRFKLPYKKLRDVPAETARLLAENKVVGWFQGKSEFGQRALGHRSILASPMKAEMKDRINAAVKFRESYRPFAPVLPISKVKDYFQTETELHVPYMEKALPFKKDKARLVPAVVHNDGTGRLQTVTEESEPLLHSLLLAFEKITNCPVLINTSFNLNGEPVVNTPEDALRTYTTSGIDALILGSFLLEKR